MRYVFDLFSFLFYSSAFRKGGVLGSHKLCYAGVHMHTQSRLQVQVRELLAFTFQTKGSFSARGREQIKVVRLL